MFDLFEIMAEFTKWQIKSEIKRKRKMNKLKER
jgi:hypothetical protein